MVMPDSPFAIMYCIEVSDNSGLSLKLMLDRGAIKTSLRLAQPWNIVLTATVLALNIIRASIVSNAVHPSNIAPPYDS